MPDFNLNEKLEVDTSTIQNSSDNLSVDQLVLDDEDCALPPGRAVFQMTIWHDG